MNDVRGSAKLLFHPGCLLISCLFSNSSALSHPRCDLARSYFLRSSLSGLEIGRQSARRTFFLSQ